MNRSQGLSIRRKLILIILGSSLVSALVACGALLVFHTLAARLGAVLALSLGLSFWLSRLFSVSLLRLVAAADADLERRVQLRTSELVSAREAAQQDVVAKSQFLANMSHEIRTPLNSVIGMTSVLQGTSLTIDQREFVESIRRSGESLLAILNDILDFSRAEAEGIEIESVPFSVRACLDEALEQVAPAAARHKLDLACYIEAGVPGLIIGDATRTRQILVNLLGNAVKFTHQGGVSATVQVEKEDGERLMLRFSVRDTGIGIPEDRLPRLFKPFSQADSSTSRLYGGTGLGLAIVLRLTQSLGGKVWVDSKPGYGSTFHFTIRCRRLDSVPAVPVDPAGLSVLMPASPGGEPIASQLPLRILLAEDNSTNQRVALLFLEKMGYKADVAASGIEVLEALGRQSYDLILMDVHMPGMDGLEATRQLRACLPPEQCPRIVAMTASALQGDREVCLTAGMDDYLSKPILFRDLQAAILRCGEAGRPAPSPPAGNRSSLVEAQIGRMEEQIGRESLRMIVETFLQDMPQRLSKMRDLADRQDGQALAFAAHALKGGSAQIGAARLVALSREIEQKGKESAFADVSSRLDELEGEVARLDPLLRQRVGAAGTVG